jgi:tRNA/rRNA methyltransferase
VTDITIIERDGHASPVVSGRTIADIVRICHDQTIDTGLASLADPALTRATLEPILTYCAERTCITDQATCSGCKRRTDSLGLATFDDFVAHHKSITADGGLSLPGRGTATLHVASLDALTKTWAGADLWFEARRVLRKLRHGVRSRAAAAARTPATKPTVILVEPQLADNIGMVARAMANFGLEELRLVKPRDGWPNERARIAASGATFIVDEALPFDTFEASLAGLNWICATTARQRDLAKPVLTPEQAVAEMRRRIGDGQRVGMLFGRERNGLETHEVANADAVVMIPVDSRFASLNIAQAVLLLSYEWMKPDPMASLGRVTTYESPKTAGDQARGFLPADKAQLLGFFEHLESELEHSGFFNPPEKRPTMVQNLRSMFTRLAASEQEVRTLRGIVKALVLGKGQSRRSRDV